MTLIQIYKTYFRIGIMTFGGGYSMIAIMEREVVTRLKWLEEREFLDMVALSQSLPGAIAVNLSSMSGSRMRSKWGALAAYGGVITPSLLIIYIIARFFEPYMDLPMVRAIFAGINPAVIGLMLASVFKLGRAIKPVPFNLLLGAFGLGAITVFGWHPLVMILAAGSAGFLMKGRVTL